MFFTRKHIAMLTHLIRAGNDTLSASGGNNYLDGGDGINSLIADGGGNILIAGSGNDYLSSSGGGSYLDDGAGNDTLVTSGGYNTLGGYARWRTCAMNDMEGRLAA